MNSHESSYFDVEEMLDTVDMKRYLDVNYSKKSLFKRALYVFRLSYFGYESLPDNACYKRKLAEYTDLMGDVFLSLDDIALKSLLEEVDKNIAENHSLLVCIQVAELKISQEVKSAQLVANRGLDNKEPTELPLCEEGKVHSEVISFPIRYDLLKELRVQGRALEFEVRAKFAGSDKWCTLANRRLRYLDIHPEGYRSWFAFDDAAVQCLVTIRFSVQSAYSNSRLTLTEHTQFIAHIFKHRYKEYLQSGDSSFDSAILHSEEKNKEQKSSLFLNANYDLEDAFWSSGSLPESPSCRCHELELAYDENDEPTVEKFCACSQWCNISAFYYHNPIFRFLMVQFANFFVKANASLPSSYMCALSHLFAQYAGSQEQIPVPLLSILNSVLSYMKLSYSKKIQFLAIDACSYKQIRSVDINNLVEVMNNREPFNAEQVACINSYFQIFRYLHCHIGKMDYFVSTDDIDAWYDLLYETIYKGYNTYLYVCTEAALHAFKGHSLIALFDHFNYNPKWVFYDLDMDQVIQMREQLYSAQHNPIYVKFKCHPFLNVIYNISKFIMEVYQPLSSGEKRTQRCQFAIKFDRLLWKELPLICSFENEIVLASLSEDNAIPALEVHLKKLHMLFALKLYSFAFTIQQYFTASLISYNQAACHGYLSYIPASLRFVFNSEWIERAYSQTFPMESLFVDQISIFKKAFANFYVAAWPPVELPMDDYHQTLENILRECGKLCLWWKIDGRNLRQFKRLIDIHRKLMANCLARADNIFTDELSPFIDRLSGCSGDVNCLIKDQIALNLVQAVCFNFVNITNCLIKSIHRLKPEKYTNENWSLTLARPGIIELISTLDTVLKNLCQLKVLFQAFNDEFDTIGRSIRATEFTVTNMYRELYIKIIWEWHCLVEFLIEKAHSTRSSLSHLVAILHFALVLEMHFVVRFHRFFRQEYHDFKLMILGLKKKLRAISGFDYDKYSRQLEDIFNYEINCTGSMPILSHPLDTAVFEALALDATALPPSELLKQLGIDVDHLS